MRISNDAFDLIVSQEVTSKEHYEAKLRHTEWPGEESGVTIGIGYDLGQTARSTIERDWNGRVSESMLSSMLSASSVTGAAAGPLANRLKESIDIPWDVATAVHKECVIPRWESKVTAALPNTDKLSGDCFGALVSLTFNRGPSFDAQADRYREMRAIKAHMAAGAFDKIPAEIRSMKRIWIGKGVDGLLRRRDAEAALFERGLSALGKSLLRVPAISPMAEPAVSNLAHRVMAAMEHKGHQIDKGPGEVNIIYIEGMDPNGVPNTNEANKWNDLRLVMRFEGDEPRIVGIWRATTEPGRYYEVEHVINPLGCARIAFGQYKAWRVGIHHPNSPSRHEALVQRGAVSVYRDLNKDFSRTGDKLDTGDSFGINQHWGYDLAEVDRASAGCLVGQSKDGHREFMKIVKSDPRYQAVPTHMFLSTVLTAADVPAEAGAEPQIGTGEHTGGAPASDVSNQVRRWQKLLGFPEEKQDGIFGAMTEEAVKRLQRSHGLPVTGDMDEETLDKLEHVAVSALGLPLTGEKRPGSDINVPNIVPTVIPNLIPKLIPSLALGIGAVNPFVGLAMTILPEFIKAVKSDNTGKVADDVTHVVTQVTQTQDPEEARNKLNTDPATVAELRIKLAQIALDQEEKCQQAQLAQLKEQNEAQLAQLKERNEREAKQREAQLVELRAEMEDTKDARSSFSALALANNPMAWGAPIVSFIVTLGFFGILSVLIVRGMRATDTQVVQIINITVGALAAAFATVVSFWLGSSQGSRAKDAMTVQLQADQVSQTNSAIATQAKQAEALKSTIEAQAKHAETLQSTVQNAIAAKTVIGASKPSNFRRCMDIVLAQEGGFSDNTGDPRGPTQFGISLGILRDVKQNQSLTVEDLKRLERQEACEIYRRRFWNVLRCDDLPMGVDLVVFDFGVNTDADQSAKMLQQIVGARDDASIGDATLGATKAMPPRAIVQEMSNRRLQYYRDSSNPPSLMRAGTDRTAAVERAALDMLAAAEASS